MSTNFVMHLTYLLFIAEAKENTRILSSDNRQSAFLYSDTRVRCHYGDSSAFQLRRRAINSNNTYHVTAFIFFHSCKWSFVEYFTNKCTGYSLRFRLLFNSAIDSLLSKIIRFIIGPKCHKGPQLDSITHHFNMLHLFTLYFYDIHIIYYALIYY